MSTPCDAEWLEYDDDTRPHPDFGVVPDGIESCPDCGERKDNCERKSSNPRHCWRWDEIGRAGTDNT